MSKHPNPNHSSNVTSEERARLIASYSGHGPLTMDEALSLDFIALRLQGAYDDEPTTTQEPGNG